MVFFGRSRSLHLRKMCARSAHARLFLNFFSEFGEKEHYRIIFIYSWDDDHDAITILWCFLEEVGLSICAKCVREAHMLGLFLNFFSEFGEKEHYRIIFIYSWDDDHDAITIL
jgi:hypothetical protein